MVASIVAPGAGTRGPGSRLLALRVLGTARHDMGWSAQRTLPASRPARPWHPEQWHTATGWKPVPQKGRPLAGARALIGARSSDSGVGRYTDRLERFHFFSVGCHWQLAASAA